MRVTNLGNCLKMVRSVRLFNSILDAAKSNDVELFKELITEIEPEDLVQCRDPTGNTVLHLLAGFRVILGLRAALSFAGQATQSLINETNNYNKTALHIAAANNNVDAITLLVDSGASLHIANHAGSTPLLSAASCGAADACRLLLDLDKTPTPASADGHNAFKDSDEAAPTVSALHAAAAAGHIRIVSLLLERGTIPVDMIAGGLTALHVAAAHGDPGILGALLDAGADVNAVNSKGDTPLHIALLHSHWLAADALLLAGADPTITSSAGANALHVAATRLIPDDTAGTDTVRTLVIIGREPILMKRDRLGRRPVDLAPRLFGTLFVLSAVERSRATDVAAGAEGERSEAALEAAVAARVEERVAHEAEVERRRQADADRIRAREVGQRKIYLEQQAKEAAEAAAAKAEAARIAAERKKKKKAKQQK